MGVARTIRSVSLAAGRDQCGIGIAKQSDDVDQGSGIGDVRRENISVPILQSPIDFRFDIKADWRLFQQTSVPAIPDKYAHRRLPPVSSDSLCGRTAKFLS